MAAVVSKVARERKELKAKLEHWRELLLQRKAGVTECKLPLGAIRLELDALLDTRVEQIGAGPLPDVWDREWVPSWPVARMYRGIEDR